MVLDQQHKGPMTQPLAAVALVTAGGADLVVLIVDEDQLFDRNVWFAGGYGASIDARLGIDTVTAVRH